MPRLSADGSGQPWKNPSQPPEKRANELLAALSTDQKIQLALGNFAALASFGVPELKADDGPDGLRNPGTTAMPSGQALAAAFDRALAPAYGQVVGSEARGEGFDEWLGPAVDIDGTPLAGRQPEAEGEDPFLAGDTAAQVISGAQSQHIISTLKHYTAYNQDWGRIGFQSPGPSVRGPGVNVAVSERALQEIYEAPFRAAVQQGHADWVMCSYNQINGLPSCQNPATLGDLKQGAGFRGFVVPDFGFAARDPVAAALAGVDLPTCRDIPPAYRRRFHLGEDSGRPAGRHRPQDPVCHLRLRGVRPPAPGKARDRGLNTSAPAGGDPGGGGGHGAAEERPPGPAPVRAGPLDRGDRPGRGRRGVRDRRLGGRPARRRAGGHPAGRDHRPRRRGRGKGHLRRRARRATWPRRRWCPPRRWPPAAEPARGLLGTYWNNGDFSGLRC